jgi:alcohol dehydrogenase class IV
MELKYLMPTRFLMGKECVRANATELAQFGKKALVVTGASSARANGSLDDVLAALAANGQAHELFDRIPPNPGIDCVYDGAALARQAGCDFVVAIGGGSPMDAAKAIALLAKTDLPREKFFAGPYGTEILPMVFVPTTAGTGSEVTPYAIITNDAAETKTGIGLPIFFPKLSLLDAKYLASVSRPTMVNTVIDSLSHSVEGMLSSRASPVSDALAVKAIALVGECLGSLADGTLSDAQREKLILASTLGGMVISNTGTTAVHAMGYSLTYFHHVDHGRANGLLLVPFLQFVQKSRPDLVQAILAPLRMNSLSALKFMMDRLLGEKEKISPDDMVKFAGKAIASKNIANCAVVPNEADLLAMFREVFSGTKESGGIATKRHSVIEFVKLEDYIPAAHFRTIPPRLRSVPRGATEIPVEFEISPALAARLKVSVTWDGKVYGYVHGSERLSGVFSGDMAKKPEDQRIYLNDWGDAFLVTFENGTRDREVSYFVTTKEVLSLFENGSIFIEPDDIYGAWGK